MTPTELRPETQPKTPGRMKPIPKWNSDFPVMPKRVPEAFSTSKICLPNKNMMPADKPIKPPKMARPLESLSPYMLTPKKVAAAPMRAATMRRI